jgi:hypothetical protein
MLPVQSDRQLNRKLKEVILVALTVKASADLTLAK